ncbi:hypothetical protein [Flavihumibacter petaseus]|uniref:Uncharacterized protein n=1 Tax=Flavihumibacter petaseus NBRC 106054 TaxID=1220578 RepID=A0A0E9N2A0_9BACT|nr:hypothetical protein [Flavihumibacter petaseus]GAO43796.1 hypothetical protein FPE01S_02_09020 [Flavihumibacter petaseus NBRC 106054]
MGKYKIGLTTIKLGAIAVDGGMGTVLTAVGDTVAGTAQMTTEDDQKTDFNIEESDSPVMSIVTTPGAITLAWSTYANDATTLQKMFGGTIVPAGSGGGETWKAPDSFPEQELSLEATWKQGGILRVPRAKIAANLNMSFKKDTLSQIDITATILQPTKANEPRISIENAN